MICKVCNYPKSHVIKTKRTENNDSTFRRHMCIKCGFRFTTIERHTKYKRKGNEWELYRALGK